MTISQLFMSTDEAMHAARALRDAGFNPRAIRIIGPGSEPSTESLVENGLARDEAQDALDAIHTGRTLLIVEAPFGTARRATQILAERTGANDEFAPMAHASASAMRPREHGWRETSAPQHHRPASSRLLPSNWTLSGMLGWRLLLPSDWTLSGALGIPLLISHS